MARGRIWHKTGDKWWSKVPEETDQYIYRIIRTGLKQKKTKKDSFVAELYGL